MRVLSAAAMLVCLCGALALLQGCVGGSSCGSLPAASESSEVAVMGNPQVAKYTYDAPGAGTVTVHFGPSTANELSTGAVTATAAGPVSVLVAGMLPNTRYHMQAVFQGADGSTATDADQVFVTGGVPCKFSAMLTATTANGATPQPGIEMLDGIDSGGLPAPVATDLAGNIIWTYPFADQGTGVTAYPIRLLTNGDLLMLIGHNSSTLLTNTTGVDTSSEIREIDLAGDVVRSLTITSLNSMLAAQGSTLTLGGFSHDILQLSDGHFIADTTTEKSVVLTGATTPTLVLGDVIVDLNADWQPVWTWNTFDHLDVNRHPFMFPDWTHANSISYDPVDSSLIYSLRHQNWVLKINYDNGAGDGSILWRLGPQGDFTLLNADGTADTDPADWFYSQHAAEYVSTNSAGLITLTLMDNGDDRQFANGQSCPVTEGTTCYTTIPILQLNEQAMTASFLFHEVLPPADYSFFGGNTDILANGDIQYDLAGLVNTNAAMYEVTDSASPQVVWSLKASDAQVYRGQRWPSLYPGVQW